MEQDVLQILQEFNEDMTEANNLNYNDLEGLIDSEEEVDDYINNRRLGLIDKTMKSLGWTWEKLENWYLRN